MRNAFAALHGIVGGTLNAAAGGRFGEGVLGAFAASRLSGLIGRIPGSGAGGDVLRATAAAVVGGTAARLGGGKFANGAVTAAFAYAFGSMGSRGGSGREGEWIYPEGGSTNLNDYYTVMTNGILGDRDAFVDALNSNPTPAAGYFNPSQGFVGDILESLGQKFFGWAGDPLAAGFAREMAGVNHPMRIIAHSQGTLTVTNAVRYYGLNARGSTFVMKSPALSRFSASRAIQGRGGSMVWQQPYGDIANIYAPSFNPLRWASGFGDIFCGACRHIGNGLP